MGSFTLNSPLYPFQSPTCKTNSNKITFSPLKINLKRQIASCMLSINSRKTKTGDFPLSCLTIDEPALVRSSSVALRVKDLDSEFKALCEPIERVKRLLDYAALLRPFDESLKIQENRVTGCTAQVWLEVKMDKNGLMRFRVDSDSEITKGFCSCLIWLLDGAEAEEVLSVRKEDLVEMNVGLQSRGNSRVNIWHNVLFGMQNRTRDLVEERDRIRRQPLDDFSSLFVANGSCKHDARRMDQNDHLVLQCFVSPPEVQQLRRNLLDLS